MGLPFLEEDRAELERRKKQEDEKPDWQKRVHEQAYVRSARNPRNIVDMYEADPVTRIPDALQDEVDRLEDQKRFQLEKSEFTAALENAYYKHRGDIPLQFWMEYNPHELRTFGGGDFDDVASWLEDVLAAQQAENEVQAEIDARFEAAVAGNQNRQALAELPFVPGFGLIGAMIPKWLDGEEVDEDALRRGIELQVRGRADELYEDEISAFMASERRLLESMREGVRRPSGQDEKVPEGMLERYDQDPYERFFLSSGDPLSSEDHARFWESETAFLERLGQETGTDIDLASVSDEEFEQILQAREQLLRQQVRGADSGQLDKILTPGRGPGFMEGAMEAVGQVMDKGLQFGGWIVEHGGLLTWPARNLTMPALEALAGNSEQARDEAVQEIMNATGAPNRDKLAEFINRDATVAFEQLEDDDPVMHEEYLRMAGMDPTLALSFFQADLLGQISPEEQTQYLSDLRAQENERIAELEEQDFTLGDDMLHVLGSYGRNVPGRLSTMFTLMLTDQDIQGLAQSGDWVGFLDAANRESEKFGHTPSAALNIDGSLTGLMIDLGSGIAFDPTTWIFGPRLGARTSQSATASQAKSLAKSRMVTRMADDVVEFSRSPSRGASSMYQAADWLDPVSMGEFLNTVDFVPQALPSSPWRAIPGHKAMEVQTDLLGKLIPDELRSSVDDVSTLGDDIIQNGFQEPLEITLSRADESLYVNDGVKRVLAAEGKDISHVPVRLRVADEAPAGVLKVPGYEDDVVRQMDELRDFEGAGTLEGNAFGAVYDDNPIGWFEEVAGDADAVINSFTHKNANYTLKFTEAPTPGRPARGGLPGVAGQKRPTWYVQDESGQIVAGYSPNAAIYNRHSKGLMHSALEASEQGGHSFLPTLLNRAQEGANFSDDGARFLRTAIDQRLSNAVPQSSRTGLPIRELLQEGEDLGKPLKKIGEGENVTMRPDAVLPKRLLHGDIDYDAVHKIFERAITERGAVPSGAQYAAVARNFNSRVRKLARDNAPGRWLQRYMTPRSVTTRFELAGVHSMDKLVDSMYRIWGDDSAKLNEWMERVMQYQQKTSARSGQAAQQLSELQPRIQRLQHMKDALGGSVFDEPLRLLDDVDLTDKNALRRLVAEEDKALRERLVQIDQETGVVGATDELENIILGMWDDYNRTYIATNPAWKDLVDPNTGMVPWEQLGKGKIKPSDAADLADDTTRALSDDMLQAADEMGVDADALMHQLSHTQNAKLATQVPVSPLELLLAREVGGSAYTRATHWGAVAQVREAAMTFHRLWVIDKVMTPATAATVSMDELLRIWHSGGTKSFVRWAGDRANMMQARTQALLHGKAPSVRKGAESLSKGQQERLRVLNDYPSYLKQAERQTFEQHGLGWTDIAPNDHGYTDAARQWTAGFLQDSGFRAFLRGEDEFRKWFLSPDGERLRRGTVVNSKGESLVIDAADEYYRGWKTLFDDVILKEAKKAGKHSDVRQAWLDIANKIDETGGMPKDLPDIAINHLGPVRGVKRDLPNQMSVSKMQEGFFDRLFMDPVNYRRGFLADLTRTHEKSRLRSLFASQGKRVVPDAEMEHMLGLQGIAGAGRTGLRDAVQEMAVKSGYIPESYLDDLVEKSVLNEIENTLYAFDASSRMGTQAKVAFPFGKPWADMAAFWGREMVRKPVLRGWINEKNALWLRSANEKGLLSFPLVPNRSAAMLSRLAHTDFTIDKGLTGDTESGLIPGSGESDFSPLFFLPTEGNNPFSYMLPGLGVVPIAFLDYLMGELHDPVKEPEQYQQLQDEIGQFIPSVHFQQGGLLSRILGGGTTAKVGGMAVDLTGMIGQESFFNLTSEMGDISREIDRTREISAMLADPEELEKLTEAKTPEAAELLIQSLAVEADKRASGSHLAESAARFMVPVSNRFDASLGEIQDVWLDAAGFEQLAPILRDDPENMTEEQQRQAANDVRSAFFQLEPWERDTLVVQQPSLAVNMVGSWEWTPNAVNENVDGTDGAYRTGGTPAELARHEALVKGGYVRPVQPIVRARRILGVIDAAKKSAAKELYVTQVDQVNEVLWEAVPEKEKAKLEWVLGTPWAEEWGLETVDEVWFNWRRLEEDLEVYLAEQDGIEPVRGPSTRKDDLTEFDKLRRAVGIEEDWKPWGTTFPGLEEDDVSSRFNEWQVLSVDEKSAGLAEALGIDVNPGMTGQELYAAVQQTITQREQPVFDVARPDYDRYIANRSTGSGRNMLFEAMQSDLVDEQWQDKIRKYLFQDELVSSRARGSESRNLSGQVTRAEQERMREEFMFIMNGAKDQKTDWEGIWEEQFERRYGPLDWEPPEPRSPFDENGEVASNVTIPSVRHVVDGDTIQIQEYPGSPVLNSVRLLGIRAEETRGPNSATALEQENALKDALLSAAENGDNIYLVRDPRFGNTDRYGRMLAWLWIGDAPFYNEEDLLPSQDPTGGER